MSLSILLFLPKVVRRTFNLLVGARRGNAKHRLSISPLSSNGHLEDQRSLVNHPKWKTLIILILPIRELGLHAIIFYSVVISSNIVLYGVLNKVVL